MKIAIIGGGYSGLTIAKKLIENNQEVTIFEKENYVGGMTSTVKLCGTQIEKYYRHIFKSDTDAIRLIKEMGIEDKLIWPATKMGYLTNRKAYAFGTPITLLKFKELNFIQKLRFGFNVVHLKLINNYKKLEKITAEEWLKKRIGNAIYSKIWEPLLISKFGEKKSQISMAWLWGKIKLRSTSSTKEGEQLGYIKGSYEELANKVYSYLIKKGVNIKLKSTVKAVTKKGDTYEILYNDTGKEEFNIIVSTIDYINMEKLFKQYMTNNEKEKCESVEYTEARTMIIVSKKSLSNFYWLNIGDNDIPFGGIIEHTNFIDKKEYENKHIIYISNYMMKENKLSKISEEELLEEYMKYLQQINSDFSKEDIIEYHVFNEKYAQPIIECNYSKKIMKNKLKNENIYICSMPQIYPEDRGMNYAIKLGNSTAESILNYSLNKK